MTERKMHYFEFHFQKIISATKGWKDDEFGAYVRLLMEQFDRGYIPDDPEELSRLITTFKKNWPRLKKKFIEPSELGQLRNTFMCGIRENAHEKSAKNAENGAKGGKAKKANATANGIPIAKRTGKRIDSQPVTSNQEPKENTVAERVGAEWFAMFRRAAGVHITDDILEIEIGKFRNKYLHAHANQSGGLINAWVSRIGFVEPQPIVPAEKRMVI